MEQKNKQQREVQCNVCGNTSKKQGRKWFPNLCFGHVGLLIVALYILVVQLMQ